MGSRSSPNFDSTFSRLAKYPSKKSVKDPKIRISKARELSPHDKKYTNSGDITILEMLIAFGIADLLSNLKFTEEEFYFIFCGFWSV